METNPFRARRTAEERPTPDPGRRRHREGGRPAVGPASAGSWPARARSYVEERVAGHTWWYRLPVLLVLAWLLLGYLVEPDHRTLFSGLTLGFHEMGHAVFQWSGSRILTAAGGTIFQLSVPAGAAVYLLLRQRDPFGATVGLFWLGTALEDAGVYAADARAQALPLVSPFGPVDPGSHDWTTLLMKFGMLSRDQAVGGALQGAGLVVMAASVLAGAWVLWLMGRASTGSATPRPGPGDS